MAMWLIQSLLCALLVRSSFQLGPLLWQEDFNGNTLDAKKWNIETGYLNVNNEMENYQAGNVQVKNGTLIITAKKETVGGQKYTSGRINTSKKFNFTYGHAEARIKLPVFQGSWPAFWLLGESITKVGWPKCGEIDIMEQVNTENSVHGTLHWYVSSASYTGGADYGTSATISNPTDWHVYAVDWTPTAIKISVDGKQYFVMDTTGTQQFHEPFFVIVNLAVGGQWPGYTIADGALPAQMLVDYIKVYGQ
jgi:beta-glucanase (GH16 family)